MAPMLMMRYEQGLDVFYSFSATPWFVLGADLQVIRPALATTTAVFPGLRAVINF
jgi:hypothetical protein